MSITRSTVRIAMFIVAVTFVAGAAVAQTAHILVPADKVQWGPAPPILPAGAQIAVLEGNPAEKGPITMRLKFPANYNIPAHWHSMTERLTVLSGSFHAGMGDKLDRKASQTLEPGGFVMLPANDASLRLDQRTDGRANQSRRAVRPLLRESGRQPATEDESAVKEDRRYGSYANRAVTFQGSRRHRSAGWRIVRVRSHALQRDDRQATRARSRAASTWRT